jgi:hypothetical protein
VHVYSTGSSCLAKLSEFERDSYQGIPTVVLIDVPYDEEHRPKRWSRGARTPSPTSNPREPVEPSDPSDIYGLKLLGHIASEIHFKRFSKLVIPVALASGFEREWAPPNIPSPSVHGSQVLSDNFRLARFIDAGAVDVLTSPLSRSKAQGLAVHAYRTFKEVSKTDPAILAAKRGRKLSWVGLQEEKPYSYLREAMVSGLMGGICEPDKEDVMRQGYVL